MRLYELAYCSNAFVHLDGFAQAAVGLRDTTGPFVDPGNSAHHGPLFRWLRRWGCRQFTIADETIASASLAAWWQTFDEQLPDPGATPDQLSDDILDGIAAAFDDLSKRQASWQDRRDVGQIFRGFGPAGAAKTLYAVRPNSCSPWDDPIRRAEDLSATGAGYRSHLAKTREALAEAVADLGPGGSAARLPVLLNRPDSSPVKLVDGARLGQVHARGRASVPGGTGAVVNLGAVALATTRRCTRCPSGRRDGRCLDRKS
jgi:hypothetical protein